jgi:anthranilate phosphoribosyltransferase
MLGPLTNPAGATRQLIGVSDERFLDTVAGALALLGSRRALVVRGEDGLDEVSISAPTTVVELDGGDIRRYTIAPEELGIPTLAPVSGSGIAGHPELAGGTPDENAAVTRAIFAGESGPRADLALINAGAAIYAAGTVASIAEGVEAARAALAGGGAARALQGYVEASLRYAPTEVAP